MNMITDGYLELGTVGGYKERTEGRKQNKYRYNRTPATKQECNWKVRDYGVNIHS